MSDPSSEPSEPPAAEENRRLMVDRQIRARGVSTERVLAAMGAVPRHEFVPADLADRAYDDGALPIGNGQTISQPFIVALMADALGISPGDRVLDVGTGSGYAAAVLAHLAAEVFTVERHRELLDQAMATLDRLHITNVRAHHTPDGLGWPEEAPFDAIAVAAASGEVPAELVRQLRTGGRMVIPIGEPGVQQLRRVRRTATGLEQVELGAVAFVPLVTDRSRP